ncbi:MAG TPA: OmpH family outer membrane protein [Caulobacteraceae bacterium]
MRRVLCAALVIGLLPPSLAAAQGAPPAASLLGGAPIAGLCMLSQQEVLTRAKVGQAATARLQVLAQQAQNEVTAERGPIDADAKALQAQRATLKPADFQEKQNALQGRAQALQQKANVRTRQIELTRQKALARISVDAQPVIAAVYKAHNCGLLVDRGSVLGGNMSNDLTAGVIDALDAKITTITFDREPLPAAALAH